MIMSAPGTKQVDRDSVRERNNCTRKISFPEGRYNRRRKSQIIKLIDREAETRRPPLGRQLLPDVCRGRFLLHTFGVNEEILDLSGKDPEFKSATGQKLVFFSQTRRQKKYFYKVNGTEEGRSIGLIHTLGNTMKVRTPNCQASSTSFSMCGRLCRRHPGMGLISTSKS